MLQHHLFQSAAFAALVSISACSSNGHLSLGGGVGESLQASAPVSDSANNDGGAGSAEGTGDGAERASSTPASAGVLDPVTGRGSSLASTGNVGTVLAQSGVTGGANTASAGGAIDPLSRVTVVGQGVTGSGVDTGQQAIGVNVGSNTAATGQTATIGVLSNGQVTSASINGATTGSLPSVPNQNLAGVAARDQQVIGAPSNNAIGASAGSPANSQGMLASANLLSGGQAANANVAGNPLTATLPGVSLTGVTPTGASASGNTGVLGAVTGAVGGAVNVPR